MLKAAGEGLCCIGGTLLARLCQGCRSSCVDAVPAGVGTIRIYRIFIGRFPKIRIRFSGGSNVKAPASGIHRGPSMCQKSTKSFPGSCSEDTKPDKSGYMCVRIVSLFACLLASYVTLCHVLLCYVMFCLVMYVYVCMYVCMYV